MKLGKELIAHIAPLFDIAPHMVQSLQIRVEVGKPIEFQVLHGHYMEGEISRFHAFARGSGDLVHSGNPVINEIIEAFKVPENCAGLVIRALPGELIDVKANYAPEFSVVWLRSLYFEKAAEQV